MKKMIAGLMALAVVAGVAQAEETLSRNAVGFVKVIIDPGALAPVVYPFDILGATETEGIKFVDTQIAQELPGGSKVYFWSGESWTPSSKSPVAALGWMGDAKTRVIKDGEMFFIQPADSATVSEYTLAGEVPSAPKTVRSISGANNLDAIGFAYPTDKKFTDTDIAKKAPGGSKVYFWSGSAWAPSSKSPVAALGWMGDAKTKVLQPGEGFFIQLPDSSVASWEEEKPYSWP